MGESYFAEVFVFVVWDGVPGKLVSAGVEELARRLDAVLQGRRGGKDLEGRAWRVQSLGRTVQQRLVRVVLYLLEPLVDVVRVVRRVGGQSQNLTGLRVQGDG